MEELELQPSAPVLLTPEGHEKIKAELHRLTTEKRKEIADRIRDSKDHGEFSEDNNELDEVKMEQAMIESRIADLKNILSGATILTEEDIPTDEVGIGSIVTVQNKDMDLEFDVRIVASIEANPDEDLISEESPFGDALYGLKVGEVAEVEAPDGVIPYTIKKIRAK
ncbi:MAG: transcription elongation factor GreA [Armatimonadetes bacterium]|nr:transcription elongation factor GreA [Armatimonadota bacterium]